MSKTPSVFCVSNLWFISPHTCPRRKTKCTHLEYCCRQVRTSHGRLDYASQSRLLSSLRLSARKSQTTTLFKPSLSCWMTMSQRSRMPPSLRYRSRCDSTRLRRSVTWYCPPFKTHTLTRRPASRQVLHWLSVRWPASSAKTTRSIRYCPF